MFSDRIRSGRPAVFCPDQSSPAMIFASGLRKLAVPRFGRHGYKRFSETFSKKLKQDIRKWS